MASSMRDGVVAPDTSRSSNSNNSDGIDRSGSRSSEKDSSHHASEGDGEDDVGFVYTYEFLWSPVQPPRRTAAQVAALQQSMTMDDAAPHFAFADRTALRALLYAVLGERNWRELLDGLLLPPPYAHDATLPQRRWTAAEVADAVHALDVDLDGVVVLLPLRLALRMGGVYDATLRAAARRLCWLLSLPFELVEAHEHALVTAVRRASAQAAQTSADGDATRSEVTTTATASPARSRDDSGGGGGDKNDTSGGGGATVRVTYDVAADQARIARERRQQRYSLRRVATVGGFAVLGGAALLVTGALAAPLVAAAYGALLSAATVTVGAVGGVGAFVFGGSAAVAAAFAVVVDVASHAAALAALVAAPVLSTSTLTALFGAGGVTLGGYRAMRRTADTDVFALRSIDEVETFASPPAVSGSGDGVVAADGGGDGDDYGEHASDAARTVRGLSATDQAVHRDKGSRRGTGGEGDGGDGGGDGARQRRPRLLGTSWDLADVVEDESQPGVVTPSHTRSVVLANVAQRRLLRSRHRAVCFAVDNALDDHELRMQAAKMVSGVWAMTPAPTIAASYAGVCACVNRFARPTGAGFVLCYAAVPLRAHGARGAVRVWVRVCRTLLATWELSCFVEPTAVTFDPFTAEAALEQAATAQRITRTQHGIVLELRRKPYVFLRLSLATRGSRCGGAANNSSSGDATSSQAQSSSSSSPSQLPCSFALVELPQRQLEHYHGVTQRRSIGVSFVNAASHELRVVDLRLTSGMQYPRTPSPVVVRPDEASLTLFTNTSWSVEGVEGWYVIEVVNANAEGNVDESTVQPQDNNDDDDNDDNDDDDDGTVKDDGTRLPRRRQHTHAALSRYAVRLRFAVTALNRIAVDVATAPTAAQLRDGTASDAAAAGNDESGRLLGGGSSLLESDMPAYEVILPPGLFFALQVRVVAASPSSSSRDHRVVQLHVHDDLERPCLYAGRLLNNNNNNNDAVACATLSRSVATTLSIGVCGYSGIFDPRRPAADQQVGLWQGALRDCALLGRTEAYALHWEDEYQTTFGDTITVDVQIAATLKKRATANVKSFVKRQLMRGAVFAGLRAYNALLATLELPRYALWASHLIDNAASTLRHRAEYAGKDLAAALLDTRARGHRPVTLLAYSFGCHVVAECLCSMRPAHARGIVENVYLLGATLPADVQLWTRLRAAVAGRVVNVHTHSDWLLTLLYHGSSVAVKPMAGTTAVNVAGVENVDVTALVAQHADYARRLREVLLAIPVQTTQASYCVRVGSSGTPAVMVPMERAADTAHDVAQSLRSLLRPTPHCAFALCNACFAEDDSDGGGSGGGDVATHSRRTRPLPPLSSSSSSPSSQQATTTTMTSTTRLSCVSSPRLMLVSCALYNGVYDVSPPLSVAMGQAGVFGVLATRRASSMTLSPHTDDEAAADDDIAAATSAADETAAGGGGGGGRSEAVGGMFAYRVDLATVAPTAPHDLLLVFLFYMGGGDGGDAAIRMTVYAHLVQRCAQRGESAAAALQRMHTIATQPLRSLTDLAALCRDGAAHTAAFALRPDTRWGSRARQLTGLHETVEVPLAGVFADHHRDALVHIHCDGGGARRGRRVGDGGGGGVVLIDVLALLTRTATALQQQQFTLRRFYALHAACVARRAVRGEGAPATASSTRPARPHDDSNNNNNDDDDSNNNKDEDDVIAPVATVHRLDDLAAVLQRTAQRHTSAHDDATDTSDSRAVTAEQQRQEGSDADCVRLVLVNSGTTPLYLVDDGDGDGDGDDDAAVTSTVPTASSTEAACVRWSVVPPPSIAARSFAIMVAQCTTSSSSSSSAAVLFRVIYETTNAHCSFALEATAGDEAAMLVQVQARLLRGPLLCGALTVSDIVKHGVRFVVVVFAQRVASSLPSLQPLPSPSSRATHDGNTDKAVIATEAAATVAAAVAAVVKQTTPLTIVPRSLREVARDEREARAVLQQYGWYVV